MSERLSRIKRLLRFDNYAQLFIDRIFFRQTRLQVYRFGKYEAIVDHRAADAGSIVNCLAGDMYQQFMDKIDLPKKATIVDLGANVGGFSLMLLAAGHDIERLLCVEFNPRTYERLRFNIRTNFEIDAHVINAAVCANEQTIEMDFGVGSTSDNIYKQKNNTDSLHRTIQGHSLDTFIDQYIGQGTIDLCKIDIEGAESEMLLQSDTSINALNRCRYVVMEMHPVEDYQAMIDVLAEHGLKVIAHEGQKDCGVHLFGRD